MTPTHVAELTLEGGFQRTLWHEIGHYLGVATDERGRSLGIALKEYSDLLEEMKADANYHEVVGELLREVLAVQSAGDMERARKFIDRYATWKDELHGVLGSNMRDAAQYRYRLVQYEALGE